MSKERGKSEGKAPKASEAPLFISRRGGFESLSYATLMTAFLSVKNGLPWGYGALGVAGYVVLIFSVLLTGWLFVTLIGKKAAVWWRKKR